MKRNDFMRSPVKHIDLEKIKTVSDLVNSFKHSSIQSRNIARCATVYENALKDKTRPTIILGLAGALIAGGLRKVIRDMIEYGIVDAVVSIGAVLYQDFYNARGYSHYRCSPVIDDIKLRELYLDRIYDTIVDEKKFEETDTYIANLASRMKPGIYSSREFMEILGREINDKNSILYTAAKHNVPVFCPAINDSSIGIGLTEYYVKNCLRKGKKPGIIIDPIRDNWEITQIKIKSKKTGAIYVSGGVPKNYIQQICVMAEIFDRDTGGHDYAIQLTTDAPHWGGLSGCTFEEAQSWGKVTKNAKKAVAYVESTIGLPLIVGYILQKKLYKGRKRLRFKWKNDMLEEIERY